MEKNEAIEKIKELLGFKKIDVKFFDVKDVDGNILRVASDALAVGDALMIVTEAGEEPAKPDTTYVLEDGSSIKTDTAGKIAELIEKTDDTEVVEAAVTKPVIDAPVIDAPVKDEPSTDLEARIIALEELVKELIMNQNSQAEATMSVANMVEEFGKTPVDSKIKNLKSTFETSREEIKDIEARNLEAIRKMRSK